ncbi:hypothetical protein ACWEOW_25345, partial [Monashia sp. NPDC004114]
MPYTIDTVTRLWAPIEFMLTTHRTPASAPDPRPVIAWADQTLAALMDTCRRRHCPEQVEPESGTPTPASTPTASAPTASRGVTEAAGGGGLHTDASTGDPETFAAAVEGELAAFELAERAKAVVDARQLDALARMHATMSAEFRAREAQTWVGRTPLTVHEAVVMEVVAATGLGESEVALRLDLAIAPASRAGFLREQVTLGVTTMARATQIIHATGHLDHEHADQVARAVLAPTRDGTGLAGALFRQRLRRAVIAADTDHAARRRAARDRTGAYAQLHDDGTGTLTIINDAEKIVAAIDRADTAARGARAGGDPRTLDQLRADFLTGAAMFAGSPDTTTPQTTTPTPATPATPSTPSTPSTTSTTPSTSSTSSTSSNGWSAPPSAATPGTAPPGAARLGAAFSAEHHDARGRDVGDGVGGVPGNVERDAVGDVRGAVAGPVEAQDGGSGAGFWRRPPATVWIVVPFSTAAGLDNQPCELPGHGWVSAAHARQIITTP